MAPSWVIRRSPGGYESIDLDDPGMDDGNRLRSVLRAQELEKVMEGREIRVAIGSVSAAMGLYIVWRVWRDSYRHARVEPRSGDSRFSFLWRVHAAEVFPLILGFNIFWSTMILVLIQSSGLHSIGVGYCKTTGAVALPALLTLGMIHFEYGLETTLRALSSVPFRRASKWRTVINMSFVAAFLLTLLITGLKLGESREKCFGSVGFRIASLDVQKGIIGVLSILISSLLVMAATIAFRLMQVVHLDADERIAASRMVYYMVASALVQVLLLPFFIQEELETLDGQLTASTVAEYAMFSQGAVLAFLHLFLRANASKTAIRPRATPWQGRNPFRMFGCNDLHIRNISSPINAAPTPLIHDPDEKYAEFMARQESLKRKRSQRQKIQKLEISSPIAIPQNVISPVLVEITSPPSKDLLTAKLSPVAPKPKEFGYNLFPGADDPKLPSAAYSPPTRTLSKSKQSNKALPPMPRKAVPKMQPQAREKNLAPPALGQLTAPSVTDVRDFANEMQGLEPPKAPWIHRRGSSSATVQIGIRISSADSDVLPISTYQPSGLRNITQPAAQTLQVEPESVRFASGLRIELDVAQAGRDLNSFRWFDAPSEVVPGPASRREEYVPSSPRASTRNRNNHKSVGWVQSPVQPPSDVSATSAPEDETRPRHWV